MLGTYQLQAGRLDEALRVLTAIAAEEPEDSRPLFGIADVYRRRGDFARAAEARRKAYELAECGTYEGRRRRGAGVRARHDRSRVCEGREWRWHGRSFVTCRSCPQLRFVSPLDIARLHAQVGNREEALALLERATSEDFTGLSLLKVDQAWDSVRADPRFAAVVRRIGIP